MADYRIKYRNQFVRVVYLLMAIFLVLTPGCATVSEKRYVENNTFKQELINTSTFTLFRAGTEIPII